MSFEEAKVVQVEDVLETLQDLASHHRDQFKIPFIAITGSNGKTTTKELLHAVLSTTYHTYTTEGNLNNHIGIPLTILKIKEDAEMAVIEMGANHQKEIEAYCRYAKPTHGLITNIGKAHLEGFGSIEGVKKGKGELFVYLEQNGGTAFINTDDPLVKELSAAITNTVDYGSRREAPGGKILSKDPFLEVEIFGKTNTSIQTNLVGSYNLPNVLAASCVGRYFDIPDEKIKEALEKYSPSNSRSQLIEKEGNRIILDAYNANPGSMKLAIENFAGMQGEKKLLFLGDMKELGNESKQEHQSIITLIDQFPWYAVILVGNNFKEIQSGYRHFNTSEEAGDWFKKEQIKEATVLIKGSRSMKMEKILGSD